MKPSMKKGGHAKAKRTKARLLFFIIDGLGVIPGLKMRANISI